MKKHNSYLAVVIAALIFVTGSLVRCGGDPTSSVGEEPEADSVTRIRLRYNNLTIQNNTLNVYLPLGTLTFTANVETTGNASQDFTLTSSDTAVATVSGKTVTLVSEGSTAITGTAVGDSTKTHTITLNVTDDDEPIDGLPEPYNITNNFGEDASTEFLAMWHNNTAVTTQKLQIVKETDPSFTGGREITVTGTYFVGTGTTIAPNAPTGNATYGAFGNYTARNIFRAHVTDLEPDTQYKYRMGDFGAWSETFYHRTAADAFAPFSFTVTGDPQDGEIERGGDNSGHTPMGVTLVAANEFDTDNRFFIMVGDIVDDTGKYPQELVNYTETANLVNIRTPIAATQGNHDTYINQTDNDQYQFNEGRAYNAFVTFPGNGHQYAGDFGGASPLRRQSHSYYFYYNNVLIVMLNSMISATASGHSTQVSWLRALLQKDKDQGLSKYIIIGTHVGPYSSRAVDRYFAGPMRQAYGPVINDFDVDIFFSGHDHMYTRSHPIKTTAAYPTSTVTPVENGTVFSLVSATGPKFYDITAGEEASVGRVFHVRTDTQAAQRPGMFVNVKVTEEKLSVEAWVAGADEPYDTYEVENKVR